MNKKDIDKMLEEGSKDPFSLEVERIRKILEELESQREPNVINRIEYWKAE